MGFLTNFLARLSTINNVPDKLSAINDLINKFEAESQKIDEREIPLTMSLNKDAIVDLKEQLRECRELVLGEFIPVKKSCDEIEKDEVIIENYNKDNKDERICLRLQLWTDSENSNTDLKQNPLVEIKKRAEEPYQSGAFSSYKGFPVDTRREDKQEIPVPGLSLVIPGVNNPREDSRPTGLISKTNVFRPFQAPIPFGESDLRSGPQQQSASRKPRRCWSPELHRRFVNALQQLGGSQVATPKQIRELMQVDGLTNDEVKSHLQKYRLHTQKIPSTTTSQFAVLGGVLMPQEQYGESSKQGNSESGSPEGPLQLTRTTGGTSTTWGDDMEDEDDEKSESHSWKNRMHSSLKVSV